MIQFFFPPQFKMAAFSAKTAPGTSPRGRVWPPYSGPPYSTQISRKNIYHYIVRTVMASRLKAMTGESGSGSSLAASLPSLLGIQYDLGRLWYCTWIQRLKPNNDQTRHPVRFVRGRLKLLVARRYKSFQFNIATNAARISNVRSDNANFKSSLGKFDSSALMALYFC